MTSKEALRTILINCKDLCIDKNYNVIHLEDLVKIILQDLERLEKLEKENQELLINKNVAQKIATKLKNDNDKLQKLLEYYDINY